MFWSVFAKLNDVNMQTCVYLLPVYSDVCTQVKGQNFTQFDCENKVMVVFPSVADDEPLVMCTCV